MPLHLRERFWAYIELWQPLLYSYTCKYPQIALAVTITVSADLLQNLSHGLNGLRDRSFATWYSNLGTFAELLLFRPLYTTPFIGHHFAAFEEAWTPVPRLVGEASGTILELGPGTGNQFPRFNRSVITRIYGLEPNEYLFAQLRDGIVEKHGLGDVYVPINAALESDEVLKSWNIDSGSLDTIVCMQVLCSVPEPFEAAKKIYRLLKPGGQLLFWEHRASRDRITRLVQRKSKCETNQVDGGIVMLISSGCWNLPWVPVVGCSLSRDIEQALMQAGDWDIKELGHDDDQPWHLMPRVWGRFVKP